jgi:hypothetical protein
MQDVEGRCSESGGRDATLEGMVESLDELITEIAKEIRLGCMGEGVEDEDEDKDGNNGGDATAPPIAVA